MNKEIKSVIDVLDLIKPLLKFDSPDDFYYLQILQRKKENPQLGSNSRVIKNYYIKSIEYLDTHYDEIKKLCTLFNARASLRLNKRSFKKTSFKTLVNISNTMSNGEFEFVKNSYDRACGLGTETKNKTWIVDLDYKDGGLEDPNYISEMISNINSCEPNPGKNKIIITLPTRNGFHLITSPFNRETFSKIYPGIDIHKDNPINLYIP